MQGSAAPTPRKWSVHVGLRWLMIDAYDAHEAISRALDRLKLRRDLVPPETITVAPATAEQLRKFERLARLHGPLSGAPRRRDVRGVTGRRHVDPGTGPLFEGAP